MKKRAISFSLLAAGSVLWAGAAGAQTPDHAGERVVIDQISESDLVAAINEIGATPTPLDEEMTVFRVEYASGAKALVNRTACTEGRCKGLLMLGYFNIPENMQEVRANEVARKFSQQYNPAAIVTNDKGEHIVKSYLIFDGGITKENLAIRLTIFGGAVRQYQQALFGDE